MRKHCAAALATALVLAAACGDDDGDQGESGTNATTATTVTTGDTASTESADAAPTSTPIADTDPTGSAPAADAACDETVPGSEITLRVLSSTGQLEPILIAGGVVGGSEAAAIYDELFTYDYETNEVVPHLAEGITSNDDFTQFTLTLREGITYSDGTPLDAQMVADNLDRYFAEGATAPHATFLQRIESKTVVDPLTLELNMSAPWAEFPSFLAEQPGMIVNTNVVGDDLQAFAAAPPDAAGVGPYVLERNASGEEIVLTARDDYWGGPVCVETLRVVMVPGDDAAYDAFTNGELDVAYVQQPMAVADAEADGVQSDFIHTDIGLMLLLNLRDGHAANDDRLREAIWLAMDGASLNERALRGTMDVSMSLIATNSPWGSEDLATVEFDPDRAAQLVDEAKADGLDATIEILGTPSPPSPDAVLAMEGMLEAVGFEVTSSNLPINDLVSRVFQQNFDASYYALNIEPSQITTRLAGALHSEGANNRGGYSSDEMDAALAEAMAADNDERAAAVARINEIYVNDFVSPVFAGFRNGIIWQDNVHGVMTNPSSIWLFHDASVE